MQGLTTDWDAHIHDALWAYSCAYKVTTRSTPFQLVYGQEEIFPIEMELPTLRIAIAERLGDEESLEQRYVMLERLDKTHAEAYLNMLPMQKHQKTYYDSKLESKVLKPNDLVLLYDSRFQKFPGKFKMRWFGPYRVLKSYPNGSIEILDFAGIIYSTRYNGYRLKKYVT